MHRLLRIALVWLLAVAVPLQAGAVASRLGCALVPGAPLSGGPPSGAHARSGNGMPAGHHHQVDLASPVHADAGAAGPCHGGASSAPAPKAKCSVCASCCVAGALPSTASAIGEGVERGQRYVLPAGTPRPAFLTAALERPPRRSTS